MPLLQNKTKTRKETYTEPKQNPHEQNRFSCPALLSCDLDILGQKSQAILTIRY